MNAGDRPRILVTGASRRVGRAVALELAGRGLDLVLTHRTSPADCEETARRCRELGGVAAEVHELHLESESALHDFAGHVSGSGIDGIVHNASRYVRTPFDRLDPEEILLHFRVNAMAPLLLTSLLSQGLRSSRLPRGGAVVCMGDIHSLGRPRGEYSAYLASKGALDRVVDCLALELGPTVRVNGVAPGVVAWAADDLTEDEQRRYVERIPMGREGTLEEAAETVAWLMLDAGYVNGSMIRLDGGRHLR